jgi:hypothetical protein
MVLLLIITVPSQVKMAALVGELFPLTVLLMIATLLPIPKFLMAPATSALFPLMVLFRIVTAPPPVLEIPPPPLKAVKQGLPWGHEVFTALPLMVLLSITNLPEL